MLIWKLLLCAAAVLADTEIRNFRLPLEGAPIRPTGPVSVITPDTGLNRFVVSRAEPELWVELDTGVDSGGWTARISWQASTPTRFEMDVVPGGGGRGSSTSKGNTGKTLLHIRAKPLSPRMPHPLLARFGWKPTLTNDDFETPFHLVLEPLLLGVVPRTALSAIGGVLGMILVAVVCVPIAIRYIERWVVRVQEEEEKAKAVKSE